MPVTRKGDATVQGVAWGKAGQCPLCEADETVRSRDSVIIKWEGELRRAHKACVAGWTVFLDEKTTH